MKNTINKIGNKAKSITKNAGMLAVDATTFTLGTIHFVAQSVADGAMSLEGVIREKTSGQVREEVKGDRVYKTIKAQDDVIRVGLTSAMAVRHAFRRDPSQPKSKASFKNKDIEVSEGYSMTPNPPAEVAEPLAYYVKQVVYKVEQAIYRLDGKIDATLKSITTGETITRVIDKVNEDRLHTINVITQN